MSLGHIKMDGIDPSNILEPGTTRTTRGVPPLRLQSTPGKHRGGSGDKVELLSPGSGDDSHLPSTDSPTEMKVELSTLLSPALDMSASPGEEDYEETPVTAGRHLQLWWRGKGSPFALTARSVSSDDFEDDSIEERNRRLVNVRQEVERYGADHPKEFNWQASIYSEHARIMAMVELLRADAKAILDVIIVEEMDAAMNSLDEARARWCRMAHIDSAVTQREPSVSGIRKLSGESGLGTAHDCGSEPGVEPPSLEDNVEPVALLNPVFVNRELTVEEQVNRSVELSSLDTDNTWVKVRSFCIEVPSFSKSFSADSPMFEELKDYEDKVHQCIEGISHTLRSHAQVQADHAQRLAKLEKKSSLTAANVSLAVVDQNTSQLHQLMQFVGDSVYPGFQDLSSGLCEVRDSFTLFAKQVFQKENFIDLSISTVAARIEEVAGMVQNSGLGTELVGTVDATQVKGVQTTDENVQPTEPVPTKDDSSGGGLGAEYQVVEQLVVADISDKSVSVTDPIPSATVTACAQSVAVNQETSTDTIANKDTPAIPLRPDEADAKLGNLKRVQLEKEIKAGMVLIDAITSSQFPQGKDEWEY